MKNRYDKIKEYLPMFERLDREYGSGQVEMIKAKAHATYDKMEKIIGKVSKGEKMHVVFILERAALYSVLKELYPEKAYNWLRECIKNKNKPAHDSLAKITQRKWGAKFFIRMMAIVGDKSFGESAGFKKEWKVKKKDEATFDMLVCPYVKYLNMLGVPELIQSFCDSDIDTYAHLPNIEFIRTQTLGTGGNKCDFQVKMKLSQ